MRLGLDHLYNMLKLQVTKKCNYMHDGAAKINITEGISPITDYYLKDLKVTNEDY